MRMPASGTNEQEATRMTPHASQPDSDGNGHLRCCDLAKIGLILAVTAGFVCQAAVWLAM
jgi:hypothetical protein